MSNPFMTLQHCARFATRQAFRTGNVAHVIATGHPAMPLMVVDDVTLLDLGERLALTDLLFTADPFADAAAS